MSDLVTSSRSVATLVGGGRMGMAMAKGWLSNLEAAGLSKVNIVDPMQSEALNTLCQQDAAELNPAQSGPVDILIVAVKPQMFGKVISDITKWVGPDTVVISVMAGITLDKLCSETGASKVVRVMPNTPGAVGAGVSAFSMSSECSDAEEASVRALLASLGTVEGPLEEDLMDAVTVVSGSGPAYAFLLVESMAAAGVALGLDEGIAQRLARQTVIGAGVLMDQDPTSATNLRVAVTSPNGTTQAALEVMMEDGGIPDVVKNALKTARDRSIALSKLD